jgi:hypothetical protein
LTGTAAGGCGRCCEKTELQAIAIISGRQSKRFGISLRLMDFWFKVCEYF